MINDEAQISDKSTSMVANLHQILKPFLLRRTKNEIGIGIPQKREYVIYAPLVPKQKLLYDAAANGQLAAVLSEQFAQEYDSDNGDESDEIVQNGRTHVDSYQDVSDTEDFSPRPMRGVAPSTRKQKKGMFISLL